MTDNIINSTNSQKMSVYCKTCVCKSCEQVAWLEPENAELKAENERLKAECDMYKTFYRAKHSDIKGILFKYRQTLQEIKVLAEKTGCRAILDLITKAEEE